ncbi:MAG TPA: hypothetical protein VNI77_11070 [Nitrososphaera sp.]|nr:hypothetical protein [Nitrososphaera sp.]
MATKTIAGPKRLTDGTEKALILATAAPISSYVIQSPARSSMADFI